jgi:hypothetical protein
MKYNTPKQTEKRMINANIDAIKAVLMKLSTIATAKPRESGRFRSRLSKIP